MNRQVPPACPKVPIMKKMILGAITALLLAQSADGQFLEIKLTNGPNLCCGYGKDNLACIMISQMPPLVDENNTIVVYTWYAKHEKGTKAWHSTMPGRWVPLPWPGSYEVWVVIQYVDRKTMYAYAAFRSNVVILNAHHCAAPSPTETSPKG
jgi:hypothetical protein